jgi:hypothetical protein
MPHLSTETTAKTIDEARQFVETGSEHVFNLQDEAVQEAEVESNKICWEMATFK